MKPIDLPQLLSKTRELVEKVADFIITVGKDFDPHFLEQKEDRSLVSFVDKEAESQIIKGLREILPEAKFLTEETYSKTLPQNEVLLWVVDPLDGTTNFVHKMPFYCISVALLKGRDVLLGIVYDLPHKTCYWAVKGQGAYTQGTSVDKQQLQVSKTNRIEDTLLAVGFFSKDLSTAERYLRALSELSIRSRGWRRLGSAALQMAYVAAGHFDVYMDTELQIWDMAAGLLLVQEAGGYTSDFSGRPITVKSNELLVGGQAHAVFLQFMRHISST